MSTILLIDDDVMGLHARACLLKAVGYQVLTAGTATGGIATMNQDVDVVVLDYCLPDMAGVEVIRSLQGVKPDVPVIVLSGMLELPEEMRREAAAVLVKGEGAERLLDAVSRCVS